MCGSLAGHRWHWEGVPTLLTLVFFIIIRQRLYSILSVLVSFESVLQNVLATGCVWLHTRVVAHTCDLSAWRWREEDCDPDTALLCSMAASTKSSCLVVVPVESKDLAVLLDSDGGCVSCQRLSTSQD